MSRTLPLPAVDRRATRSQLFRLLAGRIVREARDQKAQAQHGKVQGPGA